MARVRSRLTRKRLALGIRTGSVLTKGRSTRVVIVKRASPRERTVRIAEIVWSFFI